MFKFDSKISFRKMGLNMVRILKWIREVLRFMCLNYILPMFVFLIVNLISGNSKIALVFFSITLIVGFVMNFKELDRTVYDNNDNNDKDDF